MKRFLFTLLVTCFLFCTCYATNKDRRKSFKSWDNYEITTEKVGQDGTKFVKVWGFGKSVDKAIMNAKKNAVHACIFRGLPGAATANPTPPLVKDPDCLEKNIEYFEEFFEAGGAYLGFINLTTDGVPAGQDRRKVKGGYKVALYIQVMYDNLKVKLENDGIISKLNSGF